MSSSTAPPRVEQTTIGDDLVIPRMINGLWQLAGGHDQDVDITAAAEAMESLMDAGLDCFDMADHYGDAELVIETGIKTFERAEAAVDLALERMNLARIDLMQYDTYLHNLDHLRTLQNQGKIQHIGLTNVDAAHLELLLNSGFKITTNQVSCSVIDRRAVRGRLSSVCQEHGVGILAYGTLLGGFISEKWIGKSTPGELDVLKLNWSLQKYYRFIRAAGGWDRFQTVLRSLSQIASKHTVPIAAVATRYVLDQPGVSAVIIGSRLSTSSEKYIASNLAAFSFALDAEDHELIAEAQEGLSNVPGDCGDEYRRPPYLTATGDLSQHLRENERDTLVAKAVAEGSRIELSSGSPWEPIARYCRAVRTGNIIRISGTTANSTVPGIPVIGGNSARSQTVAVLDIIEGAIKALGGSMPDVVRTRIMVQKIEDVQQISEAHGWAFQSVGNVEKVLDTKIGWVRRRVGVRPSNTLTITRLVGPEYLVEIEAEADLGFEKVLRIY